MNGISFPVLFLRRLVNVISTLSLSNQYLKQVRAEEKAEGRQPKWTSLNPLKVSEWPWTLGNTSTAPPFVHTSSSSLPWWSSFTISMSNLSLRETESGSDDSGHIPDGLRPTPRKPPKPTPRRPEVHQDSAELDTIHQLLLNPALFDPLRTPRYPIVLTHGLYGFDSRGPTSFPSMRMHYWSNVLNILRHKIRAEVIITSVPGTGSIVSRSEALNQQLQTKAHGRGVNFLAHSMGGLDCRHLISHIKPTEYVPLSLTSIGTPHRGSPFMDWCAENIGLGKLKREEFLSRSSTDESGDATATTDSRPQSEPAAKAKDASFSITQLPSSFATLLLGIVDSPAYANLTSSYLNDVFNPQTPDDPRVKYFSVAGRMPSVNVWHPFWLPKMVLDSVEEKERDRLCTLWENEGQIEADPLWRRPREWGNDGLVTVQSAKWGEFLGIMEGCDHWELRGARGIEFGVDLPALPVIGLGGPSATVTPGGDGWGLIDWGRFVRAWKKEEKIQRDTAASVASGHAQPAPAGEELKNTDGAVIKNSTEKLTSTFDWLVEQVPGAPRLVSKGKSEDASIRTKEEMAQMRGDEKHAKEEGKETRKKSELARKEDLERFYVALSRKMYDEGL
ncbi:Alpha/Beta hydrolase protein [Mycena albidolilacea]|uniref:Alpha/Beta hydrolase protein n=1 Tax=Mycena albidolilacea TaxID=1033008 RepID=A0AAD7EJE1_9AGAR|nr:Alpha/Beta hydrolase protein [Mycena albidolilacea]